MTVLRICLLSGLLFLPQITWGALLFHEIAWMGTAEDANNEWIELYNDSESDVVVDGWTLTDDTALTINLTGTISAQSSVVLERTDDTTLPSVAAFMIYTGALANDGRTLTLKRADGGTEDRVVGGEGWALIGGSNETKETPQRVGSSWVTAPPTPGTRRQGGGSETGTQNTNTNTSIQGNTQHASRQTKTTNSSGGGGKIKMQEVPGVLSLTVHAPTIAYVNQDVLFEAIPQGVGTTIMNSLGYTWNFGDGSSGSGKRTTHTFAYPGEYIVYLEGEFARQYAAVRHEITILPTSFEITRTNNGDITITNKAPYETDISNFTLEGRYSFTFPDHTYIKRDATITIPHEKIGTENAAITLFDVQKTKVAHHGVEPEVTTYVPAHFAKQNMVRESVILPAKEEVRTPPAAQTTTPNVESVSPQNVIQIGTPQESQKAGFISRIFKKITGLFGGT